VLGTLSGEAFERKGTKARASVSRVFRRTVREVEVANEREERRAHTAIGGTVAHLEALIASGFRAGVIGLDPPWPFDTYNDRSPHVVRSKFETMPVDKIKALPSRALAADDCAIFMCATWPRMPVWAQVPRSLGTCSGLGFDCIKTNATDRWQPAAATTRANVAFPRSASNYESGGQEFESLRARQ
jgi:hypothetical protein